MNYNDLQWRVRLAAPYKVLVTSPAEMPNKCPSRTLMLVIGMRFIAAYFGDEFINVSSEEASELIGIAHEPKLEVKSVSEIKVGDKVRVVQVIVKKCDRKAYNTARLERLGWEGKVVDFTSGRSRPYDVRFGELPFCFGFRAGELMVLSAPCEQQEPDGSTGRLHKRITRLAGEVSKLNETVHRQGESLAGQIKVNEELRERNRELDESLASLQETYTNLLQTHAEYQKRFSNMLRANEHVFAQVRDILDRGAAACREQ